jgi:hypothetical protein
VARCGERLSVALYNAHKSRWNTPNRNLLPQHLVLRTFSAICCTASLLRERCPTHRLSLASDSTILLFSQTNNTIALCALLPVFAIHNAPPNMVSHRQATRDSFRRSSSRPLQLPSSSSPNSSTLNQLPYGFPRPPPLDLSQISAFAAFQRLLPSSPPPHHPPRPRLFVPSSPRRRGAVSPRSPRPRPHPSASRSLRVRRRPAGGATLRKLYIEASPAPVARASVHAIIEKRRQRAERIALSQELLRSPDKDNESSHESDVSHGLD